MPRQARGDGGPAFSLAKTTRRSLEAHGAARTNRFPDRKTGGIVPPVLDPYRPITQ